MHCPRQYRLLPPRVPCSVSVIYGDGHYDLCKAHEEEAACTAWDNASYMGLAFDCGSKPSEGGDKSDDKTDEDTDNKDDDTTDDDKSGEDTDNKDNDTTNDNTKDDGNEK